MGLVFTNIQHAFRKENKLSLNEYVLADMIHHLSVNIDSPIIGWCYMSRQSMAEEIGLSKQSILNLIDALIEKGFIIKNAETSYLKTTSQWNAVYFTNGKESLPTAKNVYKTGKESLFNNGTKSLPYNNSFNNNKKIVF